jgi:hypothetical protein
MIGETGTAKIVSSERPGEGMLSPIPPLSPSKTSLF